MSRYDPRGLLDRAMDQMIAAALLFSVAVSVFVVLVYLLISLWPYVLAAGIGFGAGWLTKSRYGW